MYYHLQEESKSLKCLYKMVPDSFYGFLSSDSFYILHILVIEQTTFLSKCLLFIPKYLYTYCSVCWEVVSS